MVINPAIVLLLIPLFSKTIYPWFSRMRVLYSPLQRMIVGGVFAGLAFVTSGLLELKLEETYPVLPDKGQATLNFVNTLDCDIGFLASFDSDVTLNAGQRRVFDVSAYNTTKYELYFAAPPQCWDIQLINPTLTISVDANEYRVETFVIGLVGRDLNLFKTDPDEFKKALSGRPKFRVIFTRDSESLTNVTVILESKNGLEDVYFAPNNSSLSESTYIELEPGLLRYTIRNGNNPEVDDESSVILEPGAVYVLILREHGGKIVFHKIFTMTPPNKIHMFWLLPQYLLISVAEVMFAISGLEFSFTQAPNSMKTVTIAAWYVGVALGNLLVIIITQARFFKSQAYEFFLFAGLICVNMIIFAIMVSRYNFVVMEADSSLVLTNAPDSGQEEFPLIQHSLLKKYTRRLSGPSGTFQTITSSPPSTTPVKQFLQ